MPIPRSRRGPALLAAFVLLLVAIALVPVVRSQQSSGPLVRVAVSIPVFADFVRQVGGERVEVRGVVPPGVDIHTFEPTPADLRSLAAVHVVFVNGRGLDDTIAALARQGPAPVWPLSEGLDAVEGGEHLVLGDAHEAHDAHDEGNPHLWLDPTMAVHYVERVRDGLSAVDPAGAERYAANAAAYITRLHALDAEIAAVLATIPPERRHLVTFHDAFPAFARRYGLKMVGVVVESPGREPSAAELAHLVTAIRTRGVRTVFTEPQFSARVLDLVARDLGIATRELYADTLTDEVPTYEQMMRINAERVAEGLR